LRKFYRVNYDGSFGAESRVLTGFKWFKFKHLLVNCWEFSEFVAQTGKGRLGLLTQVLELSRRRWWRIAACGARGVGRWRAGAQSDFADIEIFLKAIQLQKVGKFHGADVAPAGADFLLEVSDNALEIVGTEACTEELVPEPLPVKAKRKLPTC
jgi:hypothetical protein